MSDSAQPFTTVSMAEILLVQDLLRDADQVIQQLERQFPDDQRVGALRQRLNKRLSTPENNQQPADPKGHDHVVLTARGDELDLFVELTASGLAVAKRCVRYSGEQIIRLFTAHPGPRGVRTQIHDIPLLHSCARLRLTGQPAQASFAAAVGFIGRNGAFVPMASGLAKRQL